MKNYRWFTLIAALLITVCEVLVFESQSVRAPDGQADVAAVGEVGSGARSAGP